MEESEKRKERLQAMRMDAASRAEAGPSPSPCSSYSSSAPPVQLSNPLANPAPPPAGESTPPASRFDFYTDPMSAFSGSKRRSYCRGSGGGYNPPENFSSPMRSPSPMSHPSPNHPSAGSRIYHMATPAHQFQVNQSPDQSPYQMPPHVHHSGGSWRTPVPFATPFSGPGSTPVTNPGLWNRPVGSSGGSSGQSWGGFMTPGFGRGGSPHNYSGRGWGSSSGPSPGRSGGRGRGSYGHSSGRGQFYNKSMVADPWCELKPIVGNILVPLGGPGFWLPGSVTSKKPKIGESGNELNSQSSLAECLARSFEEAVNDANI